jgi:6-phosphogluconolactonase
MVSANGRTVAVANYTGGSVATFHTGPDGRLGARMVDRHAGHGRDPKRQEGPHSHSVNFTPNDAFLLSCDLGLDRVFVYRHDPRTAGVAPHSAPFVALEPGSGPRHLALHPSGHYAYVIAELTSSIAAFAWNGTTGALRQMQSISTLPFGYTGSNTTAEIVVHPSGRFVYGSNRGHDSIAAFSVDAKTGRLTSLSHTPSGGKAPRSFAIDPTGRWLIAANQLSDNLVIFAIDQHTGALKQTGAAVTVPRAVCVAFVPTAG